MDYNTGMCSVCGCHWSVHENSNKVYHVKEVEEYVDIDNLKHQYDQAMDNLSNSNKLLVQLYEKMDLTIDDLEAKCKKIRVCADYLYKNKLR